MRFSKFLAGFTGTLSIASSCPAPTSGKLQPLPLCSMDRWIVDANGDYVPIVGINWPGAAETMLPEGLGYSAIESIVQKIAGNGFNTVRLTFAIEMVDDILDNGGDVAISDALNRALGNTNGTIMLQKILTNNPQFTAKTTRLQVFDAIAAALAAHDIYVHLDNHVSKAMWCCSPTDGNSWFGDTYFDAYKWMRGISYMALHGKENWKTFSSIGLRNELRPSLTGASTLQPYNWTTWKTYMTAAASAVHTVNPDILIYFSGLDSDTNIGPGVEGSTSFDPGFTFSIASYEWADKFVWEMHDYEWTFTSCPSYEASLLNSGFDAVNESDPRANRAPLVISEWGHDETDASNAYQSGYSTCLTTFMESYQLSWMLWVLAGSYYIREGIQDYDETWGLLNHDWSGYRGNLSRTSLDQVIQATYKQYNQLQ